MALLPSSAASRTMQRHLQDDVRDHLPHIEVGLKAVVISGHPCGPGVWCASYTGIKLKKITLKSSLLNQLKKIVWEVWQGKLINKEHKKIFSIISYCAISFLHS